MPFNVATKPQASDLRDRVRFERRRTINDGMGNETGEWYSLGIRKAKLLPFYSRGQNEYVIANRLTGTTIWDLTVYCDSLTKTIQEEDRAIEIKSDGSDGKVFNIRFIADLQGNDRWLLMQVQEGVAP